MNILFIVPYIPNRIRVRPFQLIRSLVQRGHNISLVSLWGSGEELENLEELNLDQSNLHLLQLNKSRSAWNCLKALPTQSPLQAVYCWEPKLLLVLEELLQLKEDAEPFDIIHVEHLRGAKYGLWVRRWLQTHGRHTPVVWDSVDCISLLFERASRQSRSRFGRWITRLELPRTRSMERRLLHEFERVLVSSSDDAQAFKDLSEEGVSGISVLPNGVDLSYFSAGNPNHRAAKKLVLSGKMSYHANISMVLNFTDQILPEIKIRHPDVELVIVGKDPPAEVRLLGAIPGVKVTGTVPDIRPYLHQATIAVAPLTYAVGIQNKVLEAMACATPVVVSSEGARGLGFIDGGEFQIAHNNHEISMAVCRLLEDPELCEHLGQAGRQFVEQNHSWDLIASRLEEIYRELNHSTR